MIKNGSCPTCRGGQKGERCPTQVFQTLVEWPQHWGVKGYEQIKTAGSNVAEDDQEEANHAKNVVAP